MGQHAVCVTTKMFVHVSKRDHSVGSNISNSSDSRDSSENSGRKDRSNRSHVHVRTCRFFGHRSTFVSSSMLMHRPTTT
jgi:hypothetical protein